MSSQSGSSATDSTSVKSRARARRSLPSLEDVIHELWHLYELALGAPLTWTAADGTQREAVKADLRTAHDIAKTLMALAGLGGMSGALPEYEQRQRVYELIAGHPQYRHEMVKLLNKAKDE